MRDSDEATLTEIFSDPTVSRWWGDSRDAVADAMQNDEENTHYLIDLDGDTIGMIQSYEESDAMYRHAGIDIAIREPWQGKGLGADAIKALARHLFSERGHHRLTIDPAADNVNAITAYKRVGFKPVGVMRKYERGIDGSWHDGLLMDMLAEELLD